MLNIRFKVPIGSLNDAPCYLQDQEFNYFTLFHKTMHISIHFQLQCAGTTPITQRTFIIESMTQVN